MKELIYGPVSSLRYGTTLGINLLGKDKICSFNCGYCDLGRTDLTLNYVRKEHVFPSLDEIVSKLRVAVSGLKTEVKALVISGNGEPTLHPQFDEIIQGLIPVRNEILTSIPIVVLTNGAHLDSKKVITGLNLTDERVVKIDAGNDTVFKAVNNPLVRTSVAKIMNGVRKLNDCTIQSMFVRGTFDNTLPEMIEEWIEVVGILKPKSVQLMTVTRNPVDPKIIAVDEDTLYTIAHKLKKRTQLEANVYVVNRAA
jgi:wyosine [tRNA(Phe)-imidazoG37] synthetase (radical SAM superfamily)